MSNALRFFVQYEALLYFLLGLAGVIYLYRFWAAWQELRLSVYGLEREAARSRVNQSAIVLFFLLFSSVLVFVMVTFVATTLPAQEFLATPTLDLSIQTPEAARSITPASGDSITLATATALPTVNVDTGGCIPGQLVFIAPESGDILQGEVAVEGTVSVPDFGFYKFEVARASEELWLTIQAGRTRVVEDVLVENWDTSRLPPGDYVLQLVITDSQGEVLPACRIPVRIEAPENE